MNEESHFDAYARLNDLLLGYILDNEGDSLEAEGIRDEMDTHWFHMTQMEQDLMRKRNETRLAD